MLKKSSVLLAGLLVSLASWAAPTVEMTTNLGKMTIELNPEKAPKTVEMFLYNAKHGFYEGTIFHRVINNFMIQGGGFNSSMEEKKTRTPALQNEATNGLTNDRGTIAMARTREPNSATAQFFVNVVDNFGLNAPQPDGNGYAVFGKVVQGMDTVDKIRGVATTNKGMYQNVPATPIVINSATLVK